MEINFKQPDDFYDNRIMAARDGMRQTLDDVYICEDSDEELLIINYEPYKQYLLTYEVNEELDNEELNKLIDIISAFDMIVIKDIKNLVEQMLEDQIINKIIDIYLLSNDEKLYPACLKIFCNFSYLINDISQFYIPELANKMVESINSPSPDISKYTGLALGNLILDKEFYRLIVDSNLLIDLYNEFNELEIDCINKMNNLNLDVTIYINVLQILYGLLYNFFDPYQLVSHIEYAQSLLILSRTISPFSNSDIPIITLRIFKLILLNSDYFDMDLIQQEVLSLIKDDFIENLGCMIGEEDYSNDTKFILEKLMDFHKDITPIISKTLLCILRASFSSPSESRLNLLLILYKMIQEDVWHPDIDYIKCFIKIAKNGYFDEKKLSILIICKVDHIIYDQYEDELINKIFPVLFQFISNDNRSIIVPLLNTIRNMLYYSLQFVDLILDNEYEMDILHDVINDPDITSIPECEEIIRSINALMEHITSNCE